MSILRVHTKDMLAAGRLQVSDPPDGSTAFKLLLEKGGEDILSYEDLLMKLAEDSDGFSGAAIAAIARAAASRALERAVEEQAEGGTNGSGGTIMDSCLVTQDDFYEALNDVRGSMGSHDHTEDDDADAEVTNDEGNDDETKADELS